MKIEVFFQLARFTFLLVSAMTNTPIVSSLVYESVLIHPSPPMLLSFSIKYINRLFCRAFFISTNKNNRKAFHVTGFPLCEQIILLNLQYNDFYVMLPSSKCYNSNFIPYILYESFRQNNKFKCNVLLFKQLFFCLSIKK